MLNVQSGHWQFGLDQGSRMLMTLRRQNFKSLLLKISSVLEICPKLFTKLHKDCEELEPLLMIFLCVTDSERNMTKKN